MSELSDLADRPLVGALTSRLQALHSQLQAFVEQVDSLGKTPAGGKDQQVEEDTLASPCALLPSTGDGQDGLNSAEQKVTEKRHTLPVTPALSFTFGHFSLYLIFIFCCLCFSIVFFWC